MSRSRYALLALGASLFLTAPANAQIPTPSTGNARFDAAVARAVSFIQKEIMKPKEAPHGGQLSLAAYAILKAGVPPTDPAVQKALAEAKARVNNGRYTPASQQEHVYYTGVDAMLIADADPDNSMPHLRAIAQYLISVQGSDGSWDYPQRKVGDTSMNQYGILGLWACRRAGVEIPPNVWDRCIQWHLRGRSPDGGWAYHPGRQEGPGNGQSTHNMTLGAIGTVAICRMMIAPEFAPGAKKKKAKKKIFGVLEETDTDDSPAVKNPYENYRPQVNMGSVGAALDSGVNWVNTRWRTSSPIDGHKMYFYYAMERGFAMNDVKTVANGQDWYTACGNLLLQTQRKDGGWDASHGPAVGAAFGILFFVKSTAKMIGTYGNGLLAGERGFDLDNPNKDKKKRELGPLDEMLARLDNLNVEGIKDVPEEDLSDLVNKILQTPRKELIGQMDLLKKLADHPNGQVRAICMFGLGRSGDMRVAPILIDALNDNDVGVLSEARTALCYISRKPRGFGLEADLASAVEGLPQDEIDAIVNKWRKQSITRWRNWYKRIRPYDERGDLWEIGDGTRVGGGQ